MNRGFILMLLFVILITSATSVNGAVTANTGNQPVTRTQTVFYEGTNNVRQTITTELRNGKRHGKELISYFDKEGGFTYSVAVAYRDGIREGTTVRTEIVDSDEEDLKRVVTNTPYSRGKANGVETEQSFYMGSSKPFSITRTTYKDGMKHGPQEMNTYSEDGKTLIYSQKRNYRQNLLEGLSTTRFLIFSPDDYHTRKRSYLTTEYFWKGDLIGTAVHKEFSGSGMLASLEERYYEAGEMIKRTEKMFSETTGRLKSYEVADERDGEEQLVTTNYRADGKTVESVVTTNEDDEVVEKKTYLANGWHLLYDAEELSTTCVMTNGKPCNGKVTESATTNDGYPQIESTVYVDGDEQTCELLIYAKDRKRLLAKTAEVDCARKDATELYQTNGSLAARFTHKTMEDPEWFLYEREGVISFAGGTKMNVARKRPGSSVQFLYQVIDSAGRPVSGAINLRNDFYQFKGTARNGNLSGTAEWTYQWPGEARVTKNVSYLNGLQTGKGTVRVHTFPQRLHFTTDFSDGVFKIRKFDVDNKGQVITNRWIEWKDTGKQLVIDRFRTAKPGFKQPFFSETITNTLFQSIETRVSVNGKLYWTRFEDVDSDIERQTYHAQNGAVWTFEYVEDDGATVPADTANLFDEEVTSITCTDATGKPCSGPQRLDVYNYAKYDLVALSNKNFKPVDLSEFPARVSDQFVFDFKNGVLHPNSKQLHTSVEFDEKQNTSQIIFKKSAELVNGKMKRRESVFFENNKPDWVMVNIGDDDSDSLIYTVMADGAWINDETYDCSLDGKPCQGARTIKSLYPGSYQKNAVVRANYVNGKLDGTITFTYYRSDDKTVKSTRKIRYKNGAVVK